MRPVSTRVFRQDRIQPHRRTIGRLCYIQPWERGTKYIWGLAVWRFDMLNDTVAEFSGALNGIISRIASGFLTDYIGGVRAALLESVLLCELLFLQTSASQAWIE